MINNRISNMELLRLVSMFMVMITHVAFWSIAPPEAIDIKNNFMDSSVRVFMQSLSIPCVNIFILISGWFGIHASKKGLAAYLFQCLFYSILIYVVLLILGEVTLNKRNIFQILFLSRDYWFVKSYLFLYIISPALNVIVDNTSRETLKKILCSYYIFQTVFGWAYPISVWDTFADGYSPLSFIGLYLTARYCKIYKPKFTQMPAKYDFLVITLIITFVTLCYISPTLIGLNNVLIGKKLLSYISPTTLIYSLFLVLAFSKINLTSKIINWCSVSVFSVYLIHMHPNLNIHFKSIIQYFHSNYSLISFILLSFLFITVIFMLSIIFDKIRIYIWKYTQGLFIINEYLAHDNF